MQVGQRAAAFTHSRHFLRGLHDGDHLMPAVLMQMPGESVARAQVRMKEEQVMGHSY